jgi:hypothetical protein
MRQFAPSSTEVTMPCSWAAARGGSYWYNGSIYETNITEGVNIFRLRSRATAGARRLPFLNPQSQVGRVKVH